MIWIDIHEWIYDDDDDYDAWIDTYTVKKRHLDYCTRHEFWPRG
jgi:hypothetical protein